MASDPGWVPPGVDPGQANVARVYDYWLGGSHNFLADQDLGRAMAAVDPNVRAIARANRAFLGRAVRFLTAAGISQFLDIGSGIPTQGNVHEVAQQADPGARVVYVDVDPVAIAHSKTILAGRENAAIVNADLRDPERILGHPSTRRLIDFSQPVGLLFIAVFHFVVPAGHPRYVPGHAVPGEIVAAFGDRVAAGSYLAITNNCSDEASPEEVAAAEEGYKSSTAPMIVRSRGEIEAFFDGWRLVRPGVVPAWQWHSEPDESPRTQLMLGGIAVKQG